MSREKSIRIASYAGQEYVVKNSTDGRLILSKITLDVSDMRTPLSMYTNEELLDEFIRRGDPNYRYKKEGEEDEILTCVGR